jgi:hypothetical protein
MDRHASWGLAEHLLCVILPGSSGLAVGRLAGILDSDWRPFDLEGRDDDEVVRDLVSQCSHLVGPIIVVNDASYSHKCGPHFVEASQFREFAESFTDYFGEAFVSGNMVIAAPVTGEVVVVDDEGLIAHVVGRVALSLSPHYGDAFGVG